MKNSTPVIPAIRDYRNDDFPAIDRLWKNTGMGGSERGDGPEVIQKTLSLGGKLLILEDQASGGLLGTSWLTLDGRRIYLHHFAIDPVHQRKGFARLLLKASLLFAKKSDLQIKLEVHRSNSAALKLYSNGGFSYLGDYLIYIIRDFQKIDLS